MPIDAVNAEILGTSVPGGEKRLAWVLTNRVPTVEERSRPTRVTSKTKRDHEIEKCGGSPRLRSQRVRDKKDDMLARSTFAGDAAGSQERWSISRVLPEEVPCPVFILGHLIEHADPDSMLAPPIRSRDGFRPCRFRRADRVPWMSRVMLVLFRFSRGLVRLGAARETLNSLQTPLKLFRDYGSSSRLQSTPG